MQRVLLIADLEGVAGVDHTSQLFALSKDFSRGRLLLTGEVRAAIAALRARGGERFVVSDSHRPGGDLPTVIPEELGAGVEVVHTGDAYDARLMEGVDALACIGMHAAAGDEGFAAHTISINCALEQDGRALSETDVVLALAAERGVPVLFVSGDDVLGRTLSGPAYVTSKTALSPEAARSRPPAEVHADLAAAAGASPFVPEKRPGVLCIRFKSRWMAELAGDVRVGPHTVRIDAPSFAEAYRRALIAIATADEALMRCMRTFDHAALEADVEHLLLRRFPAGRPAPRRAAARRALAWFLEATAGPGPASRVADRALVLHMLEGHAARFFAEEKLAPVLHEATRALESLPVDFPAGLDVAEAMGRLDGLFIASERGAPRSFDAEALAAYVRGVAGEAPVIWAWLLGEIMGLIGLARPLAVEARAMREVRIADLYWLTHLYLLVTRYLHRPLGAGVLDAETEELCLAVPEVVAATQVDIAAEIAIALQAAGEDEVAEHQTLIELLLAQQQADGRIVDPSTVGQAGDAAEEERLAAHATGAALVALAHLT